MDNLEQRLNGLSIRIIQLEANQTQFTELLDTLVKQNKQILDLNEDVRKKASIVMKHNLGMTISQEEIDSVTP